MRLFVLAIVAAQIALPGSVRADTEADFSLRDVLPLFEKNRCIEIRDPAGQLFCGDPELSAAGARLGAAVQARLAASPIARWRSRKTSPGSGLAI